MDGITVEQREVSVLFIAQRGEPQCRCLVKTTPHRNGTDLLIAKKGTCPKKQQRPGASTNDELSFLEGWNFRLFNGPMGGIAIVSQSLLFQR